MTKSLKISCLCAVIALMLGGVNSLRAQEITAQMVDSLVSAKYNEYIPELQKISDDYAKATSQGAKDRLVKRYDRVQQRCNDENVKILKKYANTPGVMNLIFRIRTTLSKDDLQKVMESVSPEVQRTDPYYQSIQAHITGYQVAVGDTLGGFSLTTSKNYPFDYAEFKPEKDILLIFGDIATMPLDLRASLLLLYGDTNVSELEFVSVFNSLSLEALQQSAVDANVKWLMTSDYRGDRSPLRIAFGVTVEPMMVYISKGGCIEAMSIGLDDTMAQKIMEKARQ